MSWEAQGWAIKQITKSATNKWVLMCLASYADDNNECYPSIKTLIKRTELSKSTILRSIKDLARNGFIEVNERYVEFGDASRQTSNLYKLLINNGFHNETHGYQKETPPSTSMKPHIINHKESIYSDAFEMFWKVYPRNDGSKKRSYELYEKTIGKDIKESDLLSLVKKYKLIMKDKDVQYIPHCTTWLNQKRWETINEEYKNKTKLNLNQLVG